MYRLGIDIGSTYTKYCVMDDNHKIYKLFFEKTPIRQKEYFEEKFYELKKQYPYSRIVSCGYGKANIKAIKNINELVALAKGSYVLKPKTDVILDIGGQDTKIVRQEVGKLKEFFINDKCAAGSGIFLANTCKLLEIDFKKIDLSEAKRPNINLSSVCAVFAQSEITQLLADNVDPSIIVQAVIWHILIQSRVLLAKMNHSDILLSGGLSQIRGIRRYAELALERNCIVDDKSNFMSAIGCALYDII